MNLRAPQRGKRVLSVCSGICAPTVAWRPLGWSTIAFAEIEKFPSAVLAHRWPGVPNWGDLTKWEEWSDVVFDVLVGGSPCQAFSMAGARGGLDDPRGQLMLSYLAVAGRYRPRWVVWENVEGVLSSGRGRDLGALLGGLEELGYGWALRVLDSYGFGVPQRRRRVFVVGRLGDQAGPCQVLFDGESMRRDPREKREKGAGVAGALTASDGGCDLEDARSGQIVDGVTFATAEPARALVAHKGSWYGDASVDTLVGHEPDVYCTTGQGFWQEGAGTLRGREQDSHENLAVVPFDLTQITSPDNRNRAEIGDPSPPLVAVGRGIHVAVHMLQTPTSGEMSPALGSGCKAGMCSVAVSDGYWVRRLLPVEYERLMKLPDDYTRIPYRGKPAELCPDGPRYRAVGNSIAVPVLRWIGLRMDRYDAGLSVSDP